MDYEFCSCGAILPFPTSAPSVLVCVVCHAKHTIKAAKNKLIYRTEKVYNDTIHNDLEEQSKAEDPVVEKICDKCGHDKMSYTCRQTRSVDEGQTVYYTCLKCKYSIVENA
ncbi:unnamed protein product [Enterobius vermicularis]|uniref:DNA-directed RNA polymerase subunit n=1 Tax=Enterobius vermicularis TaxID=51028 RepID=A0A0N4VCU9_ENTVE|nr:unnamed protein product [Enterobius vermicularis]